MAMTPTRQATSPSMRNMFCHPREVDQNQPSEMLISHPERGPPMTNASGAPNWKKAFILARIFVGNQKVM